MNAARNIYLRLLTRIFLPFLLIAVAGNASFRTNPATSLLPVQHSEPIGHTLSATSLPFTFSEQAENFSTVIVSLANHCTAMQKWECFNEVPGNSFFHTLRSYLHYAAGISIGLPTVVLLFPFHSFW